MAATEAPPRAAGEKKMSEKDRDTQLADIRARVKDLFQNHGEAIENNEHLRFGAGIFAEMKFLLEVIDRQAAHLKKLKAPLTDE